MVYMVFEIYKPFSKKTLSENSRPRIFFHLIISKFNTGSISNSLDLLSVLYTQNRKFYKYLSNSYYYKSKSNIFSYI